MAETIGVQARNGGRANMSYHDDATFIVQGGGGQGTAPPGLAIGVQATNEGNVLMENTNFHIDQGINPEQLWKFLYDKVNGFVQDKRTKTAVAVIVYAFICRLLIPTECDMLDELANGSLNCTISDTPYNTSVGTYCSIECDDRYRLHGDNSIFCLQEGSWTAMPACELITCPAIETIKPEYGTVTCTDGNTADSKCIFTCDKGHQKFGPDEATCQRTGEWSVTEPVKCTLRACNSLQEIEFGSVQCSNNTNKVGTTCEITCLQNHVLFTHGKYYDKPDYKIECLPTEKWSEENLPRCVCPQCKTGDSCQWTTSWKVVRNNIQIFGGGSRLNYAGHEISTELGQGFHKWKHEWRCVCKDIKTDASVRCAKKGRFGACEHACSKLIIDLVSRKKYEAPCDRSSMTPDC